ncbi:MAG TPA: glycosyltransferase family 87 protein [Puia sp.]|nr:glycosyltransferase family 87 protein [Puia sp.]
MKAFNLTRKDGFPFKGLGLAFFAYALITVIATAQGLFAGPKIYVPGGRAYIDYNNYIIFKYSFFHLLHGKDIYQLFPDDHWDLYKYSPGFALCFGLLAWMPNAIGLLLWNGINSFCLFAGIRLLPGLDDRRKTWILLFCLLEMLLSIQNTQSNGLMAGLIVLAFALAERQKYFLSTLCIVFSFYIKIYGALAFVLYLFYPGKWRIAGWSLFWMVVFALIPLAVVDGHQLAFLYRSWLNLLLNDRSASVGLSVMGILETWFHWTVSKNMVALAGMVLFLMPLCYTRFYKDYSFRLLYLASVLIWTVIFNHKAESPTFIIAMSGIGIWYFSRPRKGSDLLLLILAFFLISMSVSDLVPSYIRREIVRPYGVKAVMAIVIWAKIIYEQLTFRITPAI